MTTYKAWGASIIFSILAAGAFFIAPVFAAGSTFQVPSGTYPTIQDAVNAAAAGDIIEISGAQAVTSAIAINKPLTIRGIAGAQITTTGGNNIFSIVPGGDGTTIEDLGFSKTDTVNQNLIAIQANNVSIEGNTFVGTYNLGDGQTTRAMVISPGVTGLDIGGNTINHLRQPAYFDASAGTVHNNIAGDTKGWVVASAATLTFADNAWGTNIGDIAIICGTHLANPTDTCPDANNYPDIVAMSNANNGAVIEQQTPIAANGVLSVVYVDDSAAAGGNGTKATPYQTIAPAMTRVVANGTIHIMNGAYSGAINVTKNGVKVIGESQAGVTVSLNAATPFGQGVSISGVTGVSLSNLSFIVPAGAPISYALQGYKADGLTLSDVSFAGPGKTSASHIGGVDVNTTSNITYDNASATGFYKNGFAFTSAYTGSDPASGNIALSGITASDNGWAGIAFYTVGNDHSPASVGGSHSFSHVSITGTNTVSGNAKGIQVEGSSDADQAAGTTPGNTVTSDGTTLDLTHVAFSGNSAYDILNYQTAPANAIDATFGGITGDDMTGLERTAEDGKIFDHLDIPALGLVTYYTPDTQAPTAPGPITFTNPSLSCGATTDSNTLTVNWGASTDDSGPVTYEYWVSTPGAHNDSSPYVESGLTGTSRGGAFTEGEGLYTIKVRAVDAAGNKSAYSAPCAVTYSTAVAPILSRQPTARW